MASGRLITQAQYKSRTMLKLSPTTRDLYTYLVLDADNDGIVEAYSVMSMINASDTDLWALEKCGLIYILDEEFVTYIRGFQRYNKLDARNFQISKHRQLLIQVHPELETELIVPIKREKNTKESHGIPGDSVESHGEGKGSKGTKKKYKKKSDQWDQYMRADYDYSSIENDLINSIVDDISNDIL